MRVFILQGEELDPTAVGNPPACFRPSEWEPYADMVARIGFRVPGEQPGPSRRPKYLPRESFDALRQARALREQACADCTIAYQVAQRVSGRCHPVNFDRTPIGRALGGEVVVDELEPGRPGRSLGGRHPESVRARWRERAAKRRQVEAGL